MNLPNFISLARLFSVPVLVWLILNGKFNWAFWLFLVAGASDALDGYIAKRWGQTSSLGTYLDPAADKTLLVGVYVVLGTIQQLPLWIVITVVFRDFIIIGGVVLLHISMTSVRMKPLMVSKINTTFQILLVVWTLAELGYGQVLSHVKM
ncbi:MAG: CDP-alcohol phosphatidyltransferase family protein, partial [Rhodospirillaceae bacterium]